MVSRKNFRLAFLAGVLGFVLVAAGCSSSNDPATWEEAEEKGDVQTNFVDSCEEANTDSGADADRANSYCKCALDEVREYYSDFGEFRDAESELRNDPESINNSAIIPKAVTDALDGCASQHLA